MAETFIFRKEWLDNIERLDIGTQDQIISDLARYGAGLPMQHLDNPIVATIVGSQTKRIDASVAAYEEKVTMSKSAGRKRSVDKSRIYELGILGMRAKEIADLLGCSVSTVQHSDEWKRVRQEKKDEPEVEQMEKVYSVFDF